MAVQARPIEPGTVTGMTNLDCPPMVVSGEEWLAARKELLAKEKEFTQMRDRVNAERRRLPMARVDEPNAFEDPNGKVGLVDLFKARPQLVMHLFMWINDVDADGVEVPRAAGGPSSSRPRLVARKASR